MLDGSTFSVTIDDTEARRRYLNARGTISTLLGLGVVPVINENDTVATGEIRFGDNDRLAARVAAMVMCSGRPRSCTPRSSARMWPRLDS